MLVALCCSPKMISRNIIFPILCTLKEREREKLFLSLWEKLPEERIQNGPLEASNTQCTNANSVENTQTNSCSSLCVSCVPKCKLEVKFGTSFLRPRDRWENECCPHTLRNSLRNSLQHYSLHKPVSRSHLWPRLACELANHTALELAHTHTTTQPDSVTCNSDAVVTLIMHHLRWFPELVREESASGGASLGGGSASSKERWAECWLDYCVRKNVANWKLADERLIDLCASSVAHLSTVQEPLDTGEAIASRWPF